MIGPIGEMVLIQALALQSRHSLKNPKVGVFNASGSINFLIAKGAKYGTAIEHRHIRGS